MTHLKFNSSTFVPQGHADTVTDNWPGEVVHFLDLVTAVLVRLANAKDGNAQ